MKQTISMYNASVPIFKQLLTALHAILDKAQAHIEGHLTAYGILRSKGVEIGERDYMGVY